MSRHVVVISAAGAVATLVAAVAIWRVMASEGDGPRSTGEVDRILREIEQHRERQNRMVKEGKRDEALAEYRERATKAPGDADAQYLAARLEEGPALEAAMKRVLAIDPNHLWANRALGTHYAADQPDLAGRHYEAAVRAPGSDTQDAGQALGLYYKHARFADIDRILGQWRARRPASFPDRDPFLMLGLGRTGDGLTVQLSIGLDPGKFLLAVRFVRADRRFRQISTRRSAAAFAVAWTSRWLAGEEEPDEPVTWDSPSEPGFSELHAAAVNRLRDGR